MFRARKFRVVFRGAKSSQIWYEWILPGPLIIWVDENEVILGENAKRKQDLNLATGLDQQNSDEDFTQYLKSVEWMNREFAIKMNNYNKLF